MTKYLPVILTVTALAIAAALVGYAIRNAEYRTYDGASGLAVITLLTPNGGEIWTPESVRVIHWSSDSTKGFVKIELSRDGGQTFETLLENTPNDGSEPWTVAGPSGTQLLIRVSNVDKPEVNDTSDGTFAISETSPPVS